MYDKRLKFLIAIFIAALAVAVGRLIELQVFERTDTLERIENTGVKPPEILPTLRGSITDRNGKILAIDTPEFYIAIGYELTRLRDRRFWEANAMIRADTKEGLSIDEGRRYWEDHFTKDIELLDMIVSKAYELSDAPAGSIEDEISAVNERMWRMRRYFAWKRNFPHSEDIAEFDNLGENKKLMLEGYVNDLAEMENNWYMLARISDDKLFEAQTFFHETPQVRIIPKAARQYPYRDCAAQIIGWVTPQKRDNEIFASDELLEYRSDELAGYKGVEYVCEPILRGKRGKLVYETRQAPPKEEAREFGKDVRLTIDIDLQKMLEDMLLDPLINPNSGSNTSAVVIDVQSGDILAMVSLPKFDLNTARTQFGKLLQNPRRPLENKALQAIYPPGSTIKPAILAAGLAESKVTPETTISCTLPAEEGWPRCWLQRRYGCHDDQFAGEGGTNGINAIRGSCNIYFTKLAHRLNGRRLQYWLYQFGYGHEILQQPDFTLAVGDIDTDQFDDRNIREQTGFISDTRAKGKIETFEDIPQFRNSKGEKRWFGMGQGNIRVTVLQVAAAFASIARDGVFIAPRLYLNCGEQTPPQNLGLSPSTVKTVKDGLWAVANKYHGTAYETFKNSGFKEQGISVYGKTGSTERPDNAWFAGFAEDSFGSTIAIALIVEEGQSGSHDASPLAKEVLNVCQMGGYLKGKDK
jgi:penicillin-binding protein 2